MTTTPAVGALRFEPDNCANCFEPLPDDREHRPWLYCSLLCQSTPNTIRYWRKTSGNGKFAADPDVRYAIGVRLAHMLNGGYNYTARRLPADVRVLVIDRDRVCVKCGGQGEEIDHIEGDSSEPDNLQLLCKACHRAKSAAHLVPAIQSQQDRIFALLVQRVVPDDPVQLCDDEEVWQNVELRLGSERLIRLNTSEVYRREKEKAALEASRARAAEADELDDEDDDDPRGDDYYDGGTGRTPTTRGHPPAGTATDRSTGRPPCVSVHMVAMTSLNTRFSSAKARASSCTSAVFTCVLVHPGVDVGQPIADLSS